MSKTIERGYIVLRWGQVVMMWAWWHVFSNKDTVVTLVKVLVWVRNKVRVTPMVTVGVTLVNRTPSLVAMITANTMANMAMELLRLLILEVEDKWSSTSSGSALLCDKSAKGLTCVCSNFGPVASKPTLAFIASLWRCKV